MKYKFKRTGILLAALLAMVLVVTACNGGTKNTAATKSSAESSTIGENSLQRVMTAGKLTVVGSGGYPPFNFIDDNGDVIGFDVDVGKEIAKRLGVDLNYVTGEWSGLIEGLRSGRYDGVLGSMAITEERLATVNFTIPYYYSGAQLIVRKDSGITDPTVMKGKTIAVGTGTNFEQDAKNLGAEVQLYEDDNLTLMELLNGRVDGVITDRLVELKAMAELEKGSDLVLAGDILRLEEMGIAINKEDTSLLAKIDEILLAMHDDGTLTEISAKWQNGADITVK